MKNPGFWTTLILYIIIDLILHFPGDLILHILRHSFKLKELDQIVEDGEDCDGDDVSSTIENTALETWDFHNIVFIANIVLSLEANASNIPNSV